MEFIKMLARKWLVKYFGLSATEMRTVQEIIYQNIATRCNELNEVDFSSFSFNRARLLEFLGEVSKCLSGNITHFEALRKLINYETIPLGSMVYLADAVDEFILLQLVKLEEDGSIRAPDLNVIFKEDKERLLQGLEGIASRIPSVVGTLSVSLQEIAPYQKENVTYTMLRTILDFTQVPRAHPLRYQGYERITLEKLQHRVPVSGQEIDTLIRHLKSFRWWVG